MNKTIGLKIRKIRIEHDMNQEEFSNIVGISEEDLSNFENNVSTIPIDILRKIVRIFNVDTNWLLMEEEAILQKNQKIGNVSNSTVIGANVIGNKINIHHPMSFEEMAEILENCNQHQKQINELMDTNKELHEQITGLIATVNKLTDTKG